MWARLVHGWRRIAFAILAENGEALPLRMVLRKQALWLLLAVALLVGLTMGWELGKLL